MGRSSTSRRMACRWVLPGPSGAKAPFCWIVYDTAEAVSLTRRFERRSNEFTHAWREMGSR